MRRIIWIISEGSPGHLSQSIGLADALGQLASVEVHLIECKIRVRGLVRALIRHLWMGRSGRALPMMVLRRWLDTERLPHGGAGPDLIMSSGGGSVFLARSLAVMHQVPFIFIGERKPYPPEWFHTVFTPSGAETEPCDIRMDVIPTKISPDVVKRASDEWADKPGGRLWTMLIGGSSRSHRYQDAEWRQLAQGMSELARREGFRWLVTTSRRTGKELESVLLECLDPDVVADAVWWCHSPEKKLAAYLGAAEKIWVTQDSVSMITEAVATGKPVVVVYPADLRFPAASFMPGYLANMETHGLIQRLSMARVPEHEPRGESLPTRQVLTTAALAGILLRRLGWAGANDDMSMGQFL